MVYEKTLTLTDSKQVKVIVRGYYSSNQRTTIERFFEVSVRKGGETSYYNLPGLNLPKYGSLEKMDESKIRDIVVSSSGITEQQFDQIVVDFIKITRSSVSMLPL